MNNQEVFQYARLLNFWNDRRLMLFRLLVFLILIFQVWVFLSAQTFPTFYLFVLSSILIVELFFYFGIEKVRPAANSLTVDAARLVVSSANTKELILKLLDKEEIKFVLNKANIKPRDVIVPPETTIEAILSKAPEVAQKEKADFIFSIYLFMAFLLLSEPKTKLLFNKELQEEDVYAIVHWARHYFGNTEVKEIPKIEPWGRGIGDDWVSGWTLETKRYTIDITPQVASSPPQLIGRTDEFTRLIEALERSEKNNVLLVGPPGVGKTILVQFFAYQSFLGNLPKGLSHKRVLKLLVGNLLAGAENLGFLEERIRNMLEELLHAGDVVLYIPEMQNALGAGGQKFDMSGVLTEALTNQKIFIIGTTTPENYKTLIESLASFSELFEIVEVGEPKPWKALRMLEEKIVVLEAQHKVTFTYKAVVTSVTLSEKYIPYRFLPGKAIDLLDEVAAKVALSQKNQVEEKDVVSLIEEKTHVAVGPPDKKEQAILLHLEEILHQRIVDQEEAVKTVSEALRRLRSGLAFENRPVGTFLFLGPTGVGKTETAKALSEVYFSSEEAMIRLDMSEYQHPDSIHRLLGSTESLGELTEKVIDKPFSLVLLDEFEKAHPKILDVFLQVFEDGRLSDSRGRTVSFVNTIIIATSNAGSELIRERILYAGTPRVAIGLQSSNESTKNEEHADLKAFIPELLDHLQRQGVFKTELLNRFDAIVVFEPLGEKEIREITALLLNRVSSKLKEKDMTVSFDERVIAKIAKEGFDPQFGARPLRRFIQNHIEDILSKKLLTQEIKRGNTVTFSTDAAQNITFSMNQSG